MLLISTKLSVAVNGIGLFQRQEENALPEVSPPATATGVRVVNLSLSHWDTPPQSFPALSSPFHGVLNIDQNLSW